MTDEKQVAKITDFAALQKEVNEQYAGIAQEISKRVSPTSPSIRLDNKQFVFPNGEKIAGSINVVILNFTNRNVYYASAYNPNVMTPPDCYAQNDIQSHMAPPSDVPMKQSDDCPSCPMNQFGSATNGAGKACQNQRILAVVQPDDPEAEIMLMKVSPSATRGFDNYISKLSSMLKVPPFAVITEVTFDESARYDKLEFGNPRVNPLFKEYGERVEETHALLEPRFEAPASQEATAAPADKPKSGARR